ncbi:MAG: cobalamin-dependent protein, partial [Polyangia bacterium]|nr:cobalamin-dependent protein [Polyangia bacterium]
MLHSDALGSTNIAAPPALLAASPRLAPSAPGQGTPRLTLPGNRKARILLSGVFGPFGVDDEFGRKENIMELFHNQVTRGQDLASFRFHHRSFGLYFLAANVDAEVTVLDFPSRRQFEKEVRKGYDMVGISFIAPNFSKAREMARVTRLLAPGSEIVLGGHGAAIDGVETAIDCDHVVRGEGIRWLRAHLGQDPGAPIHHPTLPSSERASILGIPLPGKPANLLVPGVGCVNGCRFCCTSHFFGRAYTPFLSTGRELFQVASRIADETGTNEFFVQDENFLKDRDRAMDLVAEMERHERFFTFHLFSSAETILRFGLDNLERLGVTFLWIGVESSTRQGNYEKNEGVDARRLVADLRSRGIIVLASGILCSEHHTGANIQREIDFMVGLEADFVQFMLLTPLPVTTLYREHEAKGTLRTDLPLEEWHGQKHLSY